MPRPVAPITPCRIAAPTTAPQFNSMLGRVQGWQAGDGGHTAIMDNGRRAWAFGDSLLADNQLHHNALVIQDKGCAKSVQMASEFIPNSQCGDDPTTAAGEGYCWGGPIAYSNGKLFMLAPQVRSVPGCVGAFCFQGVGVILFTWNVPPRGLPVLASAVPIPAAAGIFWDSALSISADGTAMYVYGYRDDGDPWTFGYDTYLAVTSPTVSPATNWAYRTAGDWSPDVMDARPIVGAISGPETSVSIHTSGGSVVMTSTADGGLGHVVTEWTSPNPWGPWTTRAVADYPDTADHMWYLPLHVAGTSGLRVISQNWPHRPLSDIPAHPADFRVLVF
jgi:hypothetical protein